LATSRERMAAHRERRYKSLHQRTLTIAEADLAAIASCGYPDVMSDDKVRSAQALGLFISDTVACLDTRGDSATQRRSRPLLRRHSSSGK
jgi:hypothetical protein